MGERRCSFASAGTRVPRRSQLRAWRGPRQFAVRFRTERKITSRFATHSCRGAGDRARITYCRPGAAESLEVVPLSPLVSRER